MPQSDIFLMAHLMRRAGFGATRDELDAYAAKGYEEMLEELLNPEDSPESIENEDLWRRYHVGENSQHALESCQFHWLYRMVNTKRPLEEKIALFWHGVFATGYGKTDQPRALLMQIDTFRRFGLGGFRHLLEKVSRDPAMIYWLDNKDNHGNAVNENYGREILELFSMGVGNYTEHDVRQCSRAFTGWTMRNAELHSTRVELNSVWPYGRLDWQYEYIDEDHDHEEKTFLGEKGRFNGEDVIDIICKQPATSRFIARHLYNFFVADEPPVPTWATGPPRDPRAIQTLMDALSTSDFNIRSALRVLFNSEFFKRAAFARVKSPAELVVGTARLTGSFHFPEPGDEELAAKTGVMGQELLDPPSVEGWHTGLEWITTANLTNRINFATEQFSDLQKPGVRAIVDRIKGQSVRVPPEQAVDACLDLMGMITLSDNCRQEIVDQAAEGGDIEFGSEEADSTSSERIMDILRLVASSREYQLA